MLALGMLTTNSLLPPFDWFEGFDQDILKPGLTASGGTFEYSFLTDASFTDCRNSFPPGNEARA